MSDTLLRVREVAEILMVSSQTVNNLITRRELSCILVGKQIRVRQSQLDAFLERNTFPKELDRQRV